MPKRYEVKFVFVDNFEANDEDPMDFEDVKACVDDCKETLSDNSLEIEGEINVQEIIQKNA